MDASEVNTGWLHQETLDGVDELNVSCETVDLVFESDESLTGVVQLIVEPAQNAPVLRRLGDSLSIEQRGRYRGKVTPLVRVPAAACPDMEVILDKGDLSFNEISTVLTIKLGKGDVDVRDGHGELSVAAGMGDVAVGRRSGAVGIKLGMGDVAVSRCTGGLTVAVGKGDIAVADSGSEIEVKTGAGDIAIARPLDAQIEVDTGKGNVALAGGEAFRLAIRTGKGDIVSTTRLSIRPGDDDDVVDDPDEESDVLDEDVILNLGDLNLGALQDLQFEAGETGVRIARGGQDLLKLGPDGVEINRGGRQISLGPEGIRVGSPRGKAGTEQRFSFNTGRGDLNVELPSDLTLRVEVLATGDVQSDVPLVSVGRPGPRGSVKRLVGVTDGGEQESRVNVLLHTRRGDVTLTAVRVTPRSSDVPDQSEVESDRDEQARVILEALARGDLSIGEAERLLAALDRSG